MDRSDLFDILFSRALGLHRYADRVLRVGSEHYAGFPPFNIIVNDDKNPSMFTIELAVAGFSRNELSVSLVKDTGIPVLMVSGNKDKSASSEGEATDKPEAADRFYVVHGLAARAFTREFTLSNDLQVKDINLNDGVLTIKLEVVKQKETTQLLQIK